MATVQSMTLARLLSLEADTVIGGHIDGSGDLILEQHDGSTINAGTALAAIPDASTTVKGKVELADNTETITGTDAVRATTPAGVAAAISAAAVPDASTTVKGKVELADNTETITGTDADRATTPAGVAAALAAYVPSASDTVKGKVELATDAETLTGTSTSLAVTPANLAYVRPAGLYVIQANKTAIVTATSTALVMAASPLSSAFGYSRASGRITVPSAGVYSVSYRYVFNTTVSGRCFVELNLAATTEYTYKIAADTVTFARNSVGASENVGIVSVPAIALNAGAQIGVSAFQSSGANRDIDGVLHIQRISL